MIPIGATMIHVLLCDKEANVLYFEVECVGCHMFVIASCFGPDSLPPMMSCLSRSQDQTKKLAIVHLMLFISRHEISELCVREK